MRVVLGGVFAFVCIIPAKTFPNGWLTSQSQCHPSVNLSFGKPNVLSHSRFPSSSAWKVLCSSSKKVDVSEKESQVKEGKDPRRPDMKFLRKKTNDMLSITSPTYNESSEPSSNPPKKNKKADRRTFHWLMDSWAFSGQPDAPENSLSLLRRMEEVSSTHPHLTPDLRSYAKLINAYTKTGKKDAGTKAHSILNEMQHTPNEFIYTSVLEAYASSGAPGAALEAEDLFYNWLHQYESSLDSSIRPTARSYNAIIYAWGRSKEMDGAKKAEDFLNAMEELYATKGLEIDYAKPNTINYNSVISAWANSEERESAERSEQILRRMEELHHDGDPEIKPNAISFNTCMDAWAKSGAESAGQNAEKLLVRMEELYKSGENLDAKPNTRSYNSVMNAYAKSRDQGAAQKAQELLERIEKLYQEGNNDVKPDFFSFATVINAWGRSNQSDKADRVLQIYQYMDKLYKAGNQSVRPNVVIFNAAINACAYTIGDISEQRRATEVTNIMFKTLEQSEYGNPDQVTYGTFLKVCQQQMPEVGIRDQVVNIIFKKCIKDGQVGKLVLEELKLLTTYEQFEKLVGISMHECDNWKELPIAWRRNVVEGKRRRRQALF